MDNKKDKKSGDGRSSLKVNQGMETPPPVSGEAAGRFRMARKNRLAPRAYFDGIMQGDRSLLSRTITMAESTLEADRVAAQEVINLCLPHSGKSVRVGITGVPGVGKSTFIEALGKHLTSGGHKIAVLAIDPSSQRSKGSILGDKTRMEELAKDPSAFIRPSSSAGALGGVTRRTRESIILCEAAGYDIIFVETVGVGQSETMVHSMVDFFLLLMLAGAGDELQGIKRGIMEMADTLVINKADGDNVARAERARAEYQNALHLFPAALSGWTPKVLTCSSIENSGIEKVWETIIEYRDLTVENGFFFENRRQQLLKVLDETIEDELKAHFFHNQDIRDTLKDLRNRVLSGAESPYAAARVLLNRYFKRETD